jgi:hypothetical protein
MAKKRQSIFERGQEQQRQRNRRFGRRAQAEGIPGVGQRIRPTLAGDIADTLRGKASNLPAVKPPRRPRVRTVSAGNMRSSRSTLRQMNRLSKTTSYGSSASRSKKR